MRVNVKLVSFILMLPIVLLKAEINLLEDLHKFFRKAIVNYIFPKDPGVVRVRKPEEVKTMNNVTTLDFIGLVERYGYSAEEHYVTTEDGYNLVIHRVSGSPLYNDQQRKKVVFLQNGWIATSDTWVMFGAAKGFAFLLADQGYDVWIGNYRGNSYCRSHIKMSPQNKDFWQFNHHEVGTRDLPAMIDYVLNCTKQKTLRFVGYSMGATVLFTLLSMKPEYNAKIKLGICLGPLIAGKEIPSIIQFIHDVIPNFKEFFDVNEIYEVFSLSSTIITIGRTLCADKAITQAICIAILSLGFGSDPAQFNTTALPEFFSHIPAGSSVQLLHHYYQNMITGKFQAYDYGYFGNYKQYGQITPIMYDLKKITAPMALFYGSNDIWVSKLNILEVYKHLPNVIVLEENSYKSFAHLDYVWAIDVKTLMNDRLIELLHEFD